MNFKFLNPTGLQSPYRQGQYMKKRKLEPWTYDILWFLNLIYYFFFVQNCCSLNKYLTLFKISGHENFLCKSFVLEKGFSDYHLKSLSPTGRSRTRCGLEADVAHPPQGFKYFAYPDTFLLTKVVEWLSYCSRTLLWFYFFRHFIPKNLAGFFLTDSSELKI